MSAASHQRCDLRAAAIAGEVADARAAWPAIAIAADGFFAYLAERVADGDEPGALHVADLYLACGCAHGDAAAIAAFDAHCLAVVDRALARLGLDAAMIDEVKQRLRRALLVPERGAPRIVSFAGRGALRSWVRVLAVHEAWGMLRTARGPLGRVDAAEDRLVDLASAGATPELEYLKRMYRQDFERAFRAAIQALSARERTLLRQHFLDGVGINELAALYRVHRATIGRWLEHAREAVLATTRRHLMESLDVPRAEIESILRLVLSQVELNLRPLLAHRGA
jgi:RNA polymerase sigma-70 factor (ECF subfamily)